MLCGFYAKGGATVFFACESVLAMENQYALGYNRFSYEGDAMGKVIISVIGTQKDHSGEENKIEFVSVGTHYQKNNKDFFRYEESGLSGLKAGHTVLKVDPAEVIILRMGQVEQKLIFQEGKIRESLYQTPYGAFALSIETRSLSINLEQGCGEIKIHYDLTMEGQWQSENRLAIVIQEEKS
ncbi:MAG: DUF1934 domain-containing protein [Sporomusaceae bacterium]|nr:DUF1934 domain-containing protein [Sporomusaceae bacterium]